MKFKKIVEGCVIQTYDPQLGWIHQEFIADHCSYEDENGDDVDIDAPGIGDFYTYYLPFDMKQPGPPLQQLGECAE